MGISNILSINNLKDKSFIVNFKHLFQSFLLLISLLFLSCSSDKIKLNTNFNADTQKTSTLTKDTNIGFNYFETSKCLDSAFKRQLVKQFFNKQKINILDYGCHLRQNIKTSQDFKKYLFRILPLEKEILEKFTIGFITENLYQNKEIPLAKEIQKYTGFVIFIREDGAYAIYPISDLKKLAQKTPEDEDDKIVEILNRIFDQYLFGSQKLVIIDNFRKISLLGNGEFLKIFRLINNLRYQDTAYYNESEVIISKFILPCMKYNFKYDSLAVLNELNQIIRIAKDSAFFSFKIIDSLELIKSRITTGKAKFNCKVGCLK